MPESIILFLASCQAKARLTRKSAWWLKMRFWYLLRKHTSVLL